MNALKTLLVALLLTTGSMAGAHAQGFPERPITIFVSFGPGSFPDTLVRTLAEHLRVSLKQPVIIDNRIGAGGAIGAAAGARAEPDGYTMTFIGSPHTAAMETQANPGFDVLRDFAPVGPMNSVQNLFVVNPTRLPNVKTVADLVAHAKANPGKLNFASSGPSTPTDLGNIMFGKKHGIDIVNVRYRDAPQAIQAMVSGEADASMLPAGNMLPLVRAGSVRALAVAAPKRWEVLPDLPNADEAGAKMYVDGWMGLMVPKATPKDRIAVLTKALSDAIQQPNYIELVRNNGGAIMPGTPEDFVKTIERDLVNLKEAVTAAGIQKQ